MSSAPVTCHILHERGVVHTLISQEGISAELQGASISFHCFNVVEEGDEAVPRVPSDIDDLKY